MFDFWFFRPNVRGTLLLNTWLTLIDWWTSLCKCCLASKISTPRSFPSWRITWSLCDHETTLRPLSFEWTKITKKKWSTTTPQTWRPRFKVKLKISDQPNFRSNPGFPEPPNSTELSHIVWKLLKMSHLNFWPQASDFQKFAKIDLFGHF